MTIEELVEKAKRLNEIQGMTESGLEIAAPQLSDITELLYELAQKLQELAEEK